MRGGWLACAALWVAGCTPPSGGGLALVGATLLDAPDGGVLEDAFVVIRNGRIDQIGPQSHVALPKDARLVDLRGRFVLPAVDVASLRSALAAASEAGEPLPVSGALRALGVPPLVPGASADLLVLAADPRTDPTRLDRVTARVRAGVYETVPEAGTR